MQAISTALNGLMEQGSWFARAKDARLMVVRASSNIRKAALRLLAGLEFHADNRSAWVVLADPYAPNDPGWQVRANRLLAHWEDRRKAFLEQEGLQMPTAAMPESAAALPRTDHRSTAVLPMWLACEAVLGAIRSPLEGLVLVVAPAAVGDVGQMLAELAALVNDPALNGCRWVWVLDAGESEASLGEKIAAPNIYCECVPDADRLAEDLAAMAKADPTNIGRAGPRGVVPPQRTDDPPPISAEDKVAAMAAAGVNAAYLQRAPELQQLLFGAAIAMQDGKGPEALRLQRGARDLAATLQLHDIAILCQVALSSYLSGLGDQKAALAELHAAITAAREHGLVQMQAQAHLAAGLLLAVAGRVTDAANQYVACARCAKTAGEPVLAIEALRMAGQVCLAARDTEQARTHFVAAIEMAQATDAQTVKGSTASEAARSLAKICADQGLAARADSLFAQADAMELGEDAGVAAAADAG
jgi:tetratricopeptide (TPR) repeat protein